MLFNHETPSETVRGENQVGNLSLVYVTFLDESKIKRKDGLLANL